LLTKEGKEFANFLTMCYYSCPPSERCLLSGAGIKNREGGLDKLEKTLYIYSPFAQRAGLL